MQEEYTFYINELYFDSVYDSNYYCDRPEFNRHHTKALWTIYQVIKDPSNNLVIVSKTGNEKFIIKNCSDFKGWIRKVYGQFDDILDSPLWTKYPHPGDFLK